MSGSYVPVATCNLNQWSLDFDGNEERTRVSLREAKKAGAKFRVGPELELTGYGCEDHFLEMDTFTHAWQALAKLLADGSTDGILADIGLPAMHRGVRYNCRAFCLNGRILLLRPKVHLADDGNYREGRWFTEWDMMRGLEDFELPRVIRRVCGQRHCSIGIGILSCDGVMVSSETCEELFTPMSPHIALGLAGVDLIANGSGSHHQLRKLSQRLDLIRGATAKGGGCYLYSNQQGCDGGRCYFDGCALVAVNGSVVAQGDQFSVRDVQVITATIDIDAIRSYRAVVASRGRQAAKPSHTPFPVITVPFSLYGNLEYDSDGEEGDGGGDGGGGGDGEGREVGKKESKRITPSPLSPPLPTPSTSPTKPCPAMPSGAIEVKLHSAEEEIGLGPACWLWDYLRRSGAGGYLLPLSGGADSASTAAIVGIMSHLVFKAIQEEKEMEVGDGPILSEVRRVVGDEEFEPTSAASIVHRVFHTVYLGTLHSSMTTFDLASDLAEELGAYHLSLRFDTVITAVITIITTLLSLSTPPRFLAHGGTHTEDIALQNLQARLRMVFTYLLAQLLPWTRKQKGFLLVLGSANVDEALRGYLTKYDCSAADLNPIGAVSKGDLRRFLHHAASQYDFPTLGKIAASTPTAELRPLPTEAEGEGEGGEDGGEAGGSGKKAGSGPQTDEEDMGMTYVELGWFGRLRKVERCGPLSMFRRLLGEWPHLPPAAVAAKVKRFFFYYNINRHKATVLPPAYHAESYSPDDNRFDLRPFLMPRFTAQFRAIDEEVERMRRAGGGE